MQMEASPTTGRSIRRHLGLALAVISVAQLMVVLDATIVNVALPSIQRGLHFSATGLEWVINAYALAFGGLLLLGGRTGDLFGRRRMFIAGLIVFAGSSLIGGFATSSAWLIAARAAQGVGGAIASPTALALITTTFPEGRPRNRAMAVYAAMSAAGGAVGLLLGGILTDLASWRWVLFVNAPIGVAAALLAPRVLTESAARAGRLDLPGALSVTGGMTSLVYGLAHAASHGWATLGTYLPLTVAGGLLATFLVVESRSDHALMPLKIFSNRNRSGAYAVMLCLGAGVFAMFFFLTQFVQNILGFSPLKAGVAFLPIPIVIAVTAQLSARLVARIGPRPLMTVGPLFAASALFWLSFISVHSSYAGGVLPPLLLLAVGMGTSFVPIVLTAVSAVAPGESGIASALVNTGQQVGGSLGLAVLVTVSAAVIRDRLATGAPLAVATAAGYGGAFRVAAGILIGAVVIALVVVRPKLAAQPAFMSGPADLEHPTGEVAAISV
jgi:EmrB/QacA subfamily drug resistance transporter